MTVLLLVESGTSTFVVGSPTVSSWDLLGFPVPVGKELTEGRV